MGVASYTLYPTDSENDTRADSSFPLEDAKCVEVIDPFGNRIRFNENLKTGRGS